MPEKRRRRTDKPIDGYFGEIEQWAERMGEIVAQKPSWNLKECTMEPLREISMTATEVIVTVDLPLTDKNAIQVRPMDNSIEISAKMRRKLALHELGISYHRGEIQEFHCRIRIPVRVSMNKMTVKYKRGMLEVRMPRKL